jgi:hypothetical protein
MASEIIRWAQDFLVPANAGMVRTFSGHATLGPVCPFVAPAIENDSLYLAFHPGITGYLVEDIGTVLESYLAAFESMRPFGQRERNLKAFLVVFPDIPVRDHRVLSVVARTYKTKFVTQGLMVAPFYPSCQDKSVHVDLYTSQAPHPFIAIRQMEMHDILFLGGKEEWFKAYDLHYGERFKEPEKLEAHHKPLLPLYLDAKKKYKKL